MRIFDKGEEYMAALGVNRVMAALHERDVGEEKIGRNKKSSRVNTRLDFWLQ